MSPLILHFDILLHTFCTHLLKLEVDLIFRIHRRPLQVGVLVGRRSRWVTCQSARYDHYIGYVSVTAYILALSSDSGFLGFGYPEVVFLLIEFLLC
jgi:hypothetical protein